MGAKQQEGADAKVGRATWPRVGDSSLTALRDPARHLGQRLAGRSRILCTGQPPAPIGRPGGSQRRCGDAGGKVRAPRSRPASTRQVSLARSLCSVRSCPQGPEKAGGPSARFPAANLTVTDRLLIGESLRAGPGCRVRASSPRTSQCSAQASAAYARSDSAAIEPAHFRHDFSSGACGGQRHGRHGRRARERGDDVQARASEAQQSNDHHTRGRDLAPEHQVRRTRSLRACRAAGVRRAGFGRRSRQRSRVLTQARAITCTCPVSRAVRK